MNSDKKFEYRIALKIYTYDLDNINKEIKHMENLKQDNVASDRLLSLYDLRIKKQEQIDNLHKKYKK